MAGKKAGFVTGANAKIKVFNKVLAYCSDVGYNITVQTIPVESMGKYEVHSNEPVSYSVDGSFSVIRYTARATTSAIVDVAANGNAPSMVADSDRTMFEHMDPKDILTSETFDLDIYEKSSGDDVHVFRVSDCRLTRRGMTLNKRGVMVDNYAFVGILGEDKDDDEVIGGSGDTDLT